MKQVVPFLTLVLFVSLSLNLHAANRFWVSNVASNWSNPANWSNISGGAGGFSVPTAADNVTFNNTRVGSCTIDVPGTVLNVPITAGYSGSILQGANTISITNNAVLSGGTFIGGSANITVGGNFTLNGAAVTSTTGILEFDGNATFLLGSFNPNNGRVRFSATGGTTTISGIIPSFYMLEFSGNGFNYNITSIGNLTVTKSLNLTGAGIFNLNTGTIDVKGDINVSNTAAGCGGTALVNINGTGIQNFTGSGIAGQGALPQLTINKSTGTLNLFNFPASSNNFTYTAGTVNAATSTFCFVDGTTTPYTVSGSLTLQNIEFLAITNQTYTITAGTTITANGDLTMAGNSRITLNTGNINAKGNIILTNTGAAGGGNATININGTGNQSLDGTSVSVSQNLLPFININKTSGTLTLKGIISESRSWTYTSGTVDAGSFNSTVAFGGNALNITSPGMSFYNVIVTANTITPTNSLIINNNLTINAGRLSPGANAINIGGNWTDYGTAGFTESTSTVNFIGSGIQTITSPGGENFASLTINNSGSGIQLNTNTTISATQKMTQGNINLSGNTLTLGLSVANNGTLIYTAGTIYGLGSFTRWFKPAVIANGSVNGLFPMGTTTDYRPFFVSAPVTGPVTGGTIRVAYNDATTNTTLPTYPDGAATIMVRKDLNWQVSTGNGLTGGNYNLRVEGTGFGLIGSVNDLRLTRASSAVGTPGINAGTTSNPQVNRTGLTLVNLTNSFFVGSVNSTNTPLPISLVSFTASPVNEEVILRWVTASETDNDHFTVQRSKDEMGWQDVVQVPGAGNSESVISYSAKDLNPYPDLSYYRLMQTDIDGKSTYSYVVPVNIRNKNSEILVYPNPASDRIKIVFPVQGKYEISIFSNSGQMVFQTISILGSGTELNLSTIKTGVYYIRILHNGINETRKIIINK